MLGKIALSSITGTSLHLTAEEVSELHGHIENLRAILRNAQPFLTKLVQEHYSENLSSVVLASALALKEGA